MCNDLLWFTRRSFLLTSVALGATVLKTPAPGAAQESTAIRPSTPTQDLLDTDRALAAQSLKVGFVAAYSSAMAPDARKLDPGSQPAIGPQAIMAQMAKYPKGDTFTWTPEEAVVATSGDLGFTWGRWTDTYRDKNGQIAHAYGKYLDVWRRGADGKWRWIADMGNSNPAPPIEP